MEIDDNERYYNYDNINLEEYASRYAGYTLLTRMRFIANTIKPLRNKALKILHDELKKGMCTSIYTEIFSEMDNSFDSDFVYDSTWVNETERQAEARMEQLIADLNAAKSSVIKETIREAFNDIGDFEYARGHLIEAAKAYLRTRDYTSMARHTEDMCVNMVTVYIGLEKMLNIVNFSNKAEDADTSVLVRDKLYAAYALVYLSQSDYLEVARKFLNIDGNIIGKFPHIISTEDIAIFATICALATFDRTDIRKSLMENRKFKSILEQVPSMRLLVQEFLDRKFSSVRCRLEELRPLLSLDIHFNSHIDKIFKLILDKMIIQYFAPYAKVDLTKMAAELGLDAKTLEASLFALISKGKLAALIDIAGNTLRRRDVDKRKQAMSSVCQLAKSHGEYMRRSILRLSLLKHKLSVVANEGFEEIEQFSGGNRGMSDGSGGFVHREHYQEHFAESSMDIGL